MPLRILLRSSWQCVNIGDIAHTPGALTLLRRFLPEAELTLWPKDVSMGVREILLRAFPGLRLAEGDLDAQGRPATAALAEAFASCDVLVHGSGPGLFARELQAWRACTGRPYGVFGITMDPMSIWAGGPLEGAPLDLARERLTGAGAPALDPATRSLVDGSAFWYLRDSLSLAHLAAQGIAAPHLAFGPDATIACQLRDDRTADAYLAAHGLQHGRYLCVVPRLRYTPYHHARPTAPSDADRRKDAWNAQHADGDHARLRGAIISWVRSTGLPVLACPEMTYQVQLAREQLVDPLPEDVRRHVVWRDAYWLTDEAAAVLSRARCVLSMECHSPLLALANGVPAIHVRQPTDTIKGQMYRDLGVGDWFIEVDDASADALWQRLEAVHRDHPAALARAAAIRDRALAIQRGMVEAVARAAGSRRIR